MQRSQVFSAMNGFLRDQGERRHKANDQYRRSGIALAIFVFGGELALGWLLEMVAWLTGGTGGVPIPWQDVRPFSSWASTVIVVIVGLILLCRFCMMWGREDVISDEYRRMNALDLRVRHILDAPPDSRSLTD